MKYDPNSRQERNFEIPQVGKHQVQIVDCCSKTSKSSGSEMIELVCKVLGNGQGHGAQLWYYIVDGEYAASMAGQVLDSIGLDSKVARDITPDLFFQKIGTVMVKHETKDRVTRAKINYWCKRENGTAAPVVSEDNIPF